MCRFEYCNFITYIGTACESQSANQSGETIVIRANPMFELIAINPLGGTLTNSSLAASDGQFFLRTHKHLWCIGKRK